MNGEDYRSRLYDMLSQEPVASSSSGVDQEQGELQDPAGSRAEIAGEDLVRERQESPESQPGALLPGPVVTQEKSGKKKKKKNKKAKEGAGGTFGLERGVETLFRTSYAAHMDLSTLADNKANIMISLNGIIVTVLLATLLPKLDAHSWLMVPMVLVLFGCLVSLGCAVFAALPRVSSKVLTLDDVRRGRGSMLFFGNFTRFSEEEYVLCMTELVQDPPRLYNSMMRDIYGLGRVLARKFQLLRVAYLAFAAGLILGVLMFVGIYFGIDTAPYSVQTPGSPLMP